MRDLQFLLGEIFFFTFLTVLRCGKNNFECETDFNYTYTLLWICRKKKKIKILLFVIFLPKITGNIQKLFRPNMKGT